MNVLVIVAFDRLLLYFGGRCVFKLRDIIKDQHRAWHEDLLTGVEIFIAHDWQRYFFNNEVRCGDSQAIIEVRQFFKSKFLAGGHVELIDDGSHCTTFISVVGKNGGRLLNFKLDENSVAFEAFWEGGDASDVGQILVVDSFKLDGARVVHERAAEGRLNIDGLVAVYSKG